jgi:hypothetical protein
MVDAPSCEMGCNPASHALGTGIEVLISKKMTILLRFLCEMWKNKKYGGREKIYSSFSFSAITQLDHRNYGILYEARFILHSFKLRVKY